MRFFGGKFVVLAGIFLFDIFFQLYAKSVGWGSANNGFSFGLLENKIPNFGFLLLVSELLFFVLLKKIIGFGWWLVIAGGSANAVARLITGSVWDYLHWPFFFSLWFNLADISITLGVVWQIWRYRSFGRIVT